jgi:hypothetical protein
VTFVFPVEPGRIFSFARSVGDTDPVFSEQLFGRTTGDPVVTPPTFVRSAEHYQPVPPGSAPAVTDADGGNSSSDAPDGASTVHAEQHFEYLAPFRAGDRVSVQTRPGRRWTKQGRSGTLAFFETVTEYRDSDDLVLVRARKVSVRLLDRREV